MSDKEHISPLGRQGHWPAFVPDAVWAPLAAGVLMLIVGALGLLAGRPWLFPSLGPTAFLQAETPERTSARFYNAVAGHLIGLGAGFLAVALLNAWQSPSVLTDHQLTGLRVWATVIAIALTLLVMLPLKASHPPAAATTLLVALGSLKTGADALNLIIGVLILAAVGELLRQVRLGKMRPRPD